MSFRKKIALRLLLLGLSVLVSLLIGELALRIFAPQPVVRSYLASDMELGHVLLPDREQIAVGRHYRYNVRTNGDGLRMDEPVDYSRDARRLLALGDSFAFGWGVEVEDSFVARLGLGIAATTPRVQLLNGGVGAYSSGHVYKALRRQIDRFDLCGAVYFLNANDLADNTNSATDYRVTSYGRRSDGSIELTDESPYSSLRSFLFTRTPYGWVRRNSHLSTLARRLVVGELEDPMNPPRTPTFGVRELSGTQADLAVEVTLAHLDRLERFTDERSLPLLILWIPAWTEIFEPDHPANRAFDRFKASSRHGVVDPAPELREIVASEGVKMAELYFPDGDPVGHFNAKGNAVYARAVQGPLLRFVRENCLPD